MKIIIAEFFCFIFFCNLAQINCANIYFKYKDNDMMYSVEKGKRSESYECKCKCYSNYHRDGWKCCKCPWTDSICFPGDATITLETKEELKMSELKLGHRIQAVNADGYIIFTEVKAFLKRYSDNLALYLDIYTEDNQMISLSESHVIYSSNTNITSTRHTKFAERLNVGEYLFTTKCGDLSLVRIKSITKSVRQGAYVPLTEEGTVVVNKMAASCYSSIDHNLAHFVLSPIRQFPWLMGSFQNEGYSPVISALKTLGHWILPENMQYNMGIEQFGLTKSEL